MLALKLTGGLLITAASGLCGNYFASAYDARLFQLNAAEQCVKTLLNAVNVYNERLETALFAVAENVKDGVFCKIMLDTATALSQNDGRKICDLWKSSACGNDFNGLKQEDEKAFISFGAGLYSTDEEIINMQADRLLRYISLKRKETEYEKEKNSRLYRSVGLLLGVTLWIMLL